MRGVATDVEVIRHMRTDKGAYDDVTGILDESDGDEYGANDVFVIPAAAAGRGVDMRTPIWGEGGDPTETQFRQKVGVALPVDEELWNYPGGECIVTHPFERAVGRRDDAQGRVDAANARRYWEGECRELDAFKIPRCVLTKGGRLVRLRPEEPIAATLFEVNRVARRP